MYSGHFVAIFGGAVAGAEAAYQFSKQGITCVVFDQNTLPYGKIEDGLPKWHNKLRDKEEEGINEKLSQPGVYFVPRVKLGRDIVFSDIVQNWGFSAILLATGAWRDRPLPVDGIGEFVNKGLYYQNPFIYWFNHYHEPTYTGPQMEIHDGAIVVGGGLASLDVVKVMMIETVQRALLERGIEVDMFTLDRSIAQVLQKHGLTLADLGLKGCTLFYRRRIIDMPLSPFPPDSPDKLLKAQQVRQKILDNYRDKYLFSVEEMKTPVDKIVENGRLTGLVFQDTRLEGDSVVPVPGSEKAYRSPLVVSSIGSVPEHINGVPVSGQVYKILQNDCCRLEGFDNVFALGNAVTGRGNINDSLKHGREVSQQLVNEYLADRESIYEEAFKTTEAGVRKRAEEIAYRLSSLPRLTPGQMDALLEKVKGLQQQAGYSGDFRAWVKEHLPVRLETLVGYGH